MYYKMANDLLCCISLYKICTEIVEACFCGSDDVLFLQRTERTGMVRANRRKTRRRIAKLRFRRKSLKSSERRHSRYESPTSLQVTQKTCLNMFNLNSLVTAISDVLFVMFRANDGDGASWHSSGHHSWHVLLRFAQQVIALARTRRKTQPSRPQSSLGHQHAQQTCQLQRTASKVVTVCCSWINDVIHILTWNLFLDASKLTSSTTFSSKAYVAVWESLKSEISTGTTFTWF